MLDTATKTIQVQPVRPSKMTAEEVGQEFGSMLLALAALVPLLSLLLWLALGTVHDLWPALLPLAPSYGQSMALLAGLYVVAAPFRARPWKWARR